MSSHDRDPLARAIAASKQEGDASPDDVRRVRRRVLETLARSETKPRRLAPWVLPLAATLAATSALAATGTLTAAARAITGMWVGPSAPGRAPDAGKPVILPTGSSASSVAMPPPVPSSVDPSPIGSSAAPPEWAAAPEGHPPTANTGQRLSVRSQPGSPSHPEVPEPSPALHLSPEGTVARAVEDPQQAPERVELDRYRAAHALHFAAQDYGRALASWDAYLAAYPSGAFALEARYNRSICLFKLGRLTEAREALRPFAEGEVPGGYRKNEARALIEAAEFK